MQETKQKSIDGVNYELTEMPATKRSIIALELKQIMTGLSAGVNGIDSDINWSKSVAGILDRIEPEKGAYLLRDIIMNGLRFPVMNTPEEYDVVFSKNYDHQVELVTDIMELNFGKTIQGIKKKLVKTEIFTQISSKLETEQKTD